MFAFEYRKKFKENGWDVYDFKREYTRIGALAENRFISCSSLVFLSVSKICIQHLSETPLTKVS